MSTALKAINKRVKVLQKKHPKSKRTSLQKQAGREWKAGKLKARRKKPAAPKKRRVAKKVARKKVARKRVARKKVVRRRKVGGNTSGNTRTATKASTSRNRTATSTKTITAHVKVGAVRRKRRTSFRAVAVRRRRVGSVGGGFKSMMPIVAIAGLGLLAYMAFKPQSAPVYIPTGNVARDSKAQEIIQTATSAGIAAAALAKLIQQLQSQSNTQLDQTYDNVVQSGDIPEYLYS